MSTIVSDLTREFYLIQIRDLEARLARYQKKCDEIELRNAEFKDNFDEQALDKKEIVSFLKKQLEQRADDIADLQERLIGLQQAKDTEKDHYEVQLATLRTEMQEIKDQLTSENMVLGGKLASLEEFRVQKEELLAKFAKLEEQLVEQEESHKEQIYMLEKKAVVYNDKLKKEMILRVNTVASEFRKVSNKQMAETTKRTLRENVAINTQLGKMSDKTMDLIQENDELREKEKNQKLQLEMFEHNEKELMQKNSSNLKVIRMLAEKAKKQEVFLAECQAKEEEFQNFKHEFGLLKDELLAKKREFNRVESEKEQCKAKFSENKQEYDKMLQEHARVSTILSVCAQTIKESLLSSQDKVTVAGIAQREATLQKLVDILDLAAQEGCGMIFDDLRPVIKDEGTAPTVSRFIPLLSKANQSSLAHYKIGDLGLVPAAKGSSSLGALNRSARASDSLVLQHKKPAVAKLSKKDVSIAPEKQSVFKIKFPSEKRTKLPAI